MERIDLAKLHENCVAISLPKILLMIITELKTLPDSSQDIKVAALIKTLQSKISEINTGDITMQLNKNITLTIKLVVVDSNYKTEVYMDEKYVVDLYRQMWSLKVSAVTAWGVFAETNRELVDELEAVLGYSMRVLSFERDNLGTLYFSPKSKCSLGVYVGVTVS